MSNEERRKKDRVRYLRLKCLVVDKYGGECVACGERDIYVLAFDHVEDDGAVRRRNKLDATGAILYRALVRCPVRTDLQVMCANCNARKRHHGKEFEKWPLTQPEGRDRLLP